MSKRNSIVDTDRRHTPLRRSPRLLHLGKNQPKFQHASTHTNDQANHLILSFSPLRHSSKTNSSPKTRKTPRKDSKELCRSSDGLRRSSRLNSGVVESQSLRRSPRFSAKQNAEEIVKNSGERDKGIKCVLNKKRGKSQMSLISGEEIEGSRLVIVAGLKASGKVERIERKGKGADQTSKEIIRVSRKRKLDEIGNGSKLVVVAGLEASGKVEGRERKGRGINQTSEEIIRISSQRKRQIQGWSKEQEMALQRAYFAAKPTPRFWKKVAKLVPGKSAQDCFDKVHSDFVTPPQLPPRSRAKKMNLSPLGHFSLSASKLLEPTELKIRSCKQQKSHLAQKNARQLLQKKHLAEQHYEADLFPVLEQNISPSTQVNEQSGLLSTPKSSQEKQIFLQKCCKRSSGCKKPLSRFSSACGTTLLSPPILKQVKNKALHEKYIDQLHCREAKRKAASSRAERYKSGKENRWEIHGQNVDVIKAAKTALLTDAQNAIDQFRNGFTSTMSNSSDTDGNDVDYNEDEGETEF